MARASPRSIMYHFVDQSKTPSVRSPRRKRKRADDQIPRSEKRLRIEETFPFLQLPGELRNRIYELAVVITARNWPLSHSNVAKKPRQGRSQATPALNSPDDKPIPFLGLTQTCKQIRSEFRSMWMGAHRVYLTGLERYLTIFLPSPAKRDTSAIGFIGTGKLKIFVRQSELKSSHSLLRLLKLKAKFPDYNFVFNHGLEVSDEFLADLNAIINNRNLEWIRWIGSKTLSQCRLQGKTLLLVVQEQYAKQWMKPSLHIRIPNGFLASLGLDAMASELKVSFAVCYT